MELKSSSFNSLQHNQTKDLPYKLSKLALLALWVIISNLYMHSFPEKTKKLKKNKQTNKQVMAVNLWKGNRTTSSLKNDTHKRAAQPKHLETYT